ncbi:MAG: FG-GAP-like repeat-containing protein [Limnohabitans sp.]|nr:FG-GAP-like repeat-containing protein [Limnohabitans sp.]
MINLKLKKKYIFILLFSTIPLLSFSQLSFSSISIPTGIPATTTGSATTRVVTADFDNDGDIDVLSQLGGTGTQVNYHQNNGAGVFTLFSGSGSPSTFSSGPFNGISFTDVQTNRTFVFDVDTDGDLDIFETNNPSSNRFLQNNNGVFTSVALPSGVPTTMAGGFARIITGDFDNDGDIDFLHQQSTTINTSIYYCENTGGGTFTTFSANASGTFTSGIFNGMTFSHIVATVGIAADYDNDGDSDLYHFQTTGTTFYRNDNGTWSVQAIPNGLPSTLSQFRFLPADFDGDGDIDVLYQLGSTINDSIYYATNNGSGVYTSIAATNGTGTFTNGPFNGLTFDHIFATTIFPFDYDNDGDIDVYRIPLGAAGNNTMYQCSGTPPTLTTRTPLNGATGVNTSTNLTLTFNENVTAGSTKNNIYIKRFSDNVTVQTIPSNSGNVSGLGTNTVTISLAPLSNSTQYYVTFEEQSFRDNQGVIFGYYNHQNRKRNAYSNKSFWSFTTGILSNENFILNTKLSIYPNPIQDYLNINFDTPLTNPRLEIVDINGRILFNQSLYSTTNKINTSSLPIGIYLFKIISKEGTATKKIIKQY